MKTICACLLALLCSCVTSRWDPYDDSSYDVVMEPSVTETEEHIQLLEAWALDTQHPMPPGLYAELGYWLAKVGRYDSASAAFEKEIERYPYADKYLQVLRELLLGVSTPDNQESTQEEPAQDAEPSGGEGE